MTSEKELLIDRCKERDKHLETLALEASRSGDDQNVWLAMATRAENTRFREKLQRAEEVK